MLLTCVYIFPTRVECVFMSPCAAYSTPCTLESLEFRNQGIEKPLNEKVEAEMGFFRYMLTFHVGETFFGLSMSIWPNASLEFRHHGHSGLQF